MCLVSLGWWCGKWSGVGPLARGGARDSSPCHSLSPAAARGGGTPARPPRHRGPRRPPCTPPTPARRGWQRCPSTGLWVWNACSRPPRSPRSRHSSPHRLSPPSLFFPTHSAEAKRSVELPVALTVAVGSALASPLAAQVSLAEQRCGEWRETGAPPRGRSAEEREERDPHPPLYPACGRPQIEAASSPSLTLQPLLAPLSLSLP